MSVNVEIFFVSASKLGVLAVFIRILPRFDLMERVDFGFTSRDDCIEHGFGTGNTLPPGTDIMDWQVCVFIACFFFFFEFTSTVTVID